MRRALAGLVRPDPFSASKYFCVDGCGFNHGSLCSCQSSVIHCQHPEVKRVRLCRGSFGLIWALRESCFTVPLRLTEVNAQVLLH